jgi:hypothetical protein
MRHPKTIEVATLLVRAIEPDAAASTAISRSGADIRDALTKRHVSAQPCLQVQDSETAASIYLGEAVTLVTSSYAIVGSVLRTWLVARRGRKVQFKASTAGLQCEASTPEEITQLLDQLKSYTGRAKAAAGPVRTGHTGDECGSSVR